MANLTFKTAELKALLADAERAWAADERVRTYCGHYDEPGLWLVGDEGIYLLHNGKTHLRTDGTISPTDVEASGASLAVVYAQECDPRKGDTWDSKRALYGGDDGVELIAANEARRWILGLIANNRESGVIKITPDSLTIVHLPS